MKTLLKIILALAAFGLAISPLAVRAQSSACQYSTCVPVSPFQNLDLKQIYGAIITSSGGSGGTVAISSGTVSVTNTVTITGNVGGYSTKPTCSLSPDGTFTLGNLIVATQTVANVFRSAGGTAFLTDVTVIDNSGENTALLLDFWDTTPTGTVSAGANAVFTGYGFYLGSVEISNSDFITSGGVSRAVISGLNMVLKNRDSTQNLYVTITNRATSVNYVAPGDKILIRFGVLQD